VFEQELVESRIGWIARVEGEPGCQHLVKEHQQAEARKARRKQSKAHCRYE
jgi:hypothetical protein